MTTFPTTIKAIQSGLANQEFTAVELVEAIFSTIETKDKDINAFLALNRAEAIEQAKNADQRGYDPSSSPILNGVPVVVKDNIMTKNLESTAASKMLEGFVPTYDATVVEKLKEHGAIIIGKANLDEFAMGASTETSYYKVTRNPWDLNRVPGGSSGGSAAAVASRQIPVSLGTDTGGSIRQPAAFNGVVGLKPSYGVVSRFGAIAFGSSLDVVGPLALTVEDAALILEAIAGHDDNDMTSYPQSQYNFREKINQPIKGLRIAFPKEFKSDLVDEEIRQSIQAAEEFFVSQGAIVEEVSLEHLSDAISAYYIISSAEAASNLQRFDGMRYGFRAPEAKDIEEIYVQSRSQGFGSEVKRRIMLGTYSLISDHYDLFFLKAAQVRTLVKESFAKIFENYDAIMGPTTISTAYPLGQKPENPVETYMADILTVPINLAGLPAISLPCGFDSQNLPIGLQLIGEPLSEAVLIQIAHHFEQNHPFVNQVPEL